MPAPVNPCPRFVTITLTTSGQAYQLSERIHAADSQYPTAGPLPASYVSLQFDPELVFGGKKLRVGNSDLTSTTGQVVISGNFLPQPSWSIPAPQINLTDIYLMADVNAAIVAVCFLKP